MSKIFFLTVMFFAAMAITGCKKENNGIYINFVNAVGEPVKAVLVNGKAIGDIGKDGETAAFLFEQFNGSKASPRCSLSALVNNIPVSNDIYWCGLEPMLSLEAGRYTMVISAFQMQGKTFFSSRFR